MPLSDLKTAVPPGAGIAELRQTVHRVASRLEQATRLALTEVAGPDPDAAAEYLLVALADLDEDLTALRTHVAP